MSPGKEALDYGAGRYGYRVALRWTTSKHRGPQLRYLIGQWWNIRRGPPIN
ncbi:hypothetical protein KDK_63740 [Dictyobacter kobayashii]|uniref:Uncharacterized protein n=1 Tax=Dictyobacter kobayashii TaxID=2014872 RepID=A0A402AU16_9CHLR|nr:hypothetical protein KDK_63740 [Dictyobacter kobayashii]